MGSVEDFNTFENKRTDLNIRISKIHQEQSNLEDKLADLDAQADRLIEELHTLENNYYGDDE